MTDATRSRIGTIGWMDLTVAGPRAHGQDGRYCVIEDPAGAVCALYESRRT